MIEEQVRTETKPRSSVWMVLGGVLLGLILVLGSFSLGFIAGRSSEVQGAFPLDFLHLGERNATVTPSVQLPAQGGTPDELQELFAPFWQTWNIVVEEYVSQPVDQVEMMRGALRGMLESLGDEHTTYLDPEMFARASAQLEGEEYEGIGAWVDTTGDYLTIISPMPGSPAEKAGLKPNDKIIAIDGEDMTGVDGEVARQKVLGPEGTIVRLTILREGMEPFDVEVERARIVVPTVEARMLEGDIAYVRLYTFGTHTARDLKAELKKLMQQKPRGLILDLRYNGGGFLETAIDVASQFISEGVIMYEVYGDGTRITYEARKGGVATEIPLVVLINEGSASASEIVAGAIQDLGRGKLVGMPSFGKGSVQNYVRLVNDQGAVRVTIAHWLTPHERQIDGVGLQPDVVVELTDEDWASGNDPQLEKAIEILMQE